MWRKLRERASRLNKNPDNPEDRGQIGAALLERLRDEVGHCELTYRKRPVAMAGGKFSSTYAFELESAPAPWTGPMVFRLLASPDQVRLEAALHQAAKADGLGAPRLLLWDAEDPQMGSGFLVMEREPGRTYLRGVEPWRFALDLPKLVSAWPRRLFQVLEALARVAPDAAIRTLRDHEVPDDLARPGRHLRHVTTTLEGEARLGGVLEWLHENRPDPPKRPSLVHGDLWPGNVFIDNQGVRLIDWTRGGIDDPALDVGFARVGFLLMPEPFPPPPLIRDAVALAGQSIAQRIAARCEPLVGGTERVQYYEALRCAVELSDVVTERAAAIRPGWEHGVPALVRHLENITQQPIAFN